MLHMDFSKCIRLMNVSFKPNNGFDVDKRLISDYQIIKKYFICFMAFSTEFFMFRKFW